MARVRIVDETANLDLAAKRIIWGKLINVGQTARLLTICWFIQENELVENEKGCGRLLWFEPFENEVGMKIINEKHFNRLPRTCKSEKVSRRI